MKILAGCTLLLHKFFLRPNLPCFHRTLILYIHDIQRMSQDYLQSGSRRLSRIFYMDWANIQSRGDKGRFCKHLHILSYNTRYCWHRRRGLLRCSKLRIYYIERIIQPNSLWQVLLYP